MNFINLILKKFFMKLLNTKIKDLKIIKSNIYKDSRGFLRETYRKNIIGNKNFPFDIITYSKKNVLRGLHFQSKNPQAKIITVSYGKIFDVAVDLRKNSKTFGKYFSIILSYNDNFSFYIPENFAHGLCLSINVWSIINYPDTEIQILKNFRLERSTYKY